MGKRIDRRRVRAAQASGPEHVSLLSEWVLTGADISIVASFVRGEMTTDYAVEVLVERDWEPKEARELLETTFLMRPLRATRVK